MDDAAYANLVESVPLYTDKIFSRLRFPPVAKNIVCTVVFSTRINLSRLVHTLPNAEYRPQSFAAVIVRFAPPKACALVFATGKCVLIGCRTMHGVEVCCHKIAQILNDTGHAVHNYTYTIRNCVMTASVPYQIDLVRMHAQNKGTTKYVPEKFRGLIFRISNPKVVVVIFKSGKFNIVGYKDHKQGLAGYERALAMIRKYPLFNPIAPKNGSSSASTTTVVTAASSSGNTTTTIAKKNNNKEDNVVQRATERKLGDLNVDMVLKVIDEAETNPDGADAVLLETLAAVGADTAGAKSVSLATNSSAAAATKRKISVLGNGTADDTTPAASAVSGKKRQREESSTVNAEAPATKKSHAAKSPVKRSMFDMSRGYSRNQRKAPFAAATSMSSLSKYKALTLTTAKRKAPTLPAEKHQKLHVPPPSSAAAATADAPNIAVMGRDLYMQSLAAYSKPRNPWEKGGPSGPPLNPPARLDSVVSH